MLMDEEMAQYLGFGDDPNGLQIVRGLSAEKRALYSTMHDVEVEVCLWQVGILPKPRGVIIDMDRRRTPTTNKDGETE